MKYQAADPGAGVSAATAGLTAALVGFTVGNGSAGVSTVSGVCTPEAAELVWVAGLAEPVAVVSAGGTAVSVVLEPVAVTAEDGLGAVDDCLAEGRVRADPAVVVARVDFEGAPDSLAELALGPEPGEPPSGAADATP